MIPIPDNAVQITPVPFSTLVGAANTSDGGRVVLGVQMFYGPLWFFLSPEHARTSTAELTAGAQTADTGIVIASNGDVPPFPGKLS